MKQSIELGPTAEGTAPMANVFVVQNNISSIVAHRVIEIRGFDKASCTMLVGRGMKSQDENIKDLPFDYHFAHFWPRRYCFWRTWATVRQFDEWVIINIGEPFHAFIPNSRQFQYGLLTTHRLCRAFSYIESGTSAYFAAGEAEKNLDHPWPDPVRVALSFRGRLPLRECYFKDGHATAYGISDHSFPSLKRRFTIPSPFRNVKQYHDVEHLLVCGPIADVGFVSCESYISAIGELLKELTNRGTKSLHVKYHSRQRREPRLPYLNQLEAMFEECGMVVKLLPPEVNLEDIVASSDATVYTMGGSVALYGTLLGKRVVSLLPRMFRDSREVDNFYTRYPRLYRDIVGV